MENKNKTSRTLVNVIGIPSLLYIIYAGGELFILLLAAIMLIGAFELISLSKIKKADPFDWILYGGLLGVCALYYCGKGQTLEWIMFIVVMAMLFEVFRASDSPFLNIAFICLGMIWLGLLIGSMIHIRLEYGLGITLSMFLSIWTCDTFAFFFGKTFGNKKILPSISPNKTWLGSISGLLGSFLCMSIFYYGGDSYYGYLSPDFQLPVNFSLCNVLVLSFIYGFFGQLGDFAESAFKRDVGVKDSGDFLRGHGGILDRFDSLTFAAPLVLIYLKDFI